MYTLDMMIKQFTLLQTLNTQIQKIRKQFSKRDVFTNVDAEGFGFQLIQMMTNKAIYFF